MWEAKEKAIMQHCPLGTLEKQPFFKYNEIVAEAGKWQSHCHTFMQKGGGCR